MSRVDATPAGSTTRIATRTGRASRVSLAAIEIKQLLESQAISEWTRTGTFLRVGTFLHGEVRRQDPTVSRIHLEIQHGSRGLLVRDMGSTRGPWIDGVRLSGGPLEPGRVPCAGACELAVAPARADLVAPPREVSSHRELSDRARPGVVSSASSRPWRRQRPRSSCKASRAPATS